MLTLKMTREQAIKLGFVYCGSCGFPPNNHFLDHKDKKCAHSGKCTGYVEKVRFAVEGGE